MYIMLCEKYILAPECREEYLPVDCPEGALVRFGGRSYLSNYYEIIRPNPACARIIFTISGNGRLETGGKIYELNAGDVCLLPPGQGHYYYLSDSSWEIAWFVLNETAQFPASPLRSPVQRCSYNNLLGEIITQLAQPDELRLNMDLRMQLKAILAAYVERQLESFHSVPVSGERLKFARLYHLIAQNLEYPWDLDALMKRGRLYYSKVHFNRLCRRYWGETAIKTVMQLRLQESAKLLKYSDYPIKLIARRVGYKNEYAYSTAFKRYFKMTPTDYGKF